MRPLERVPAVRRIDTDRNDLFAVTITGDFNAADAENLCGLLEGAYALSERIDLLVRISELDGVDVSELQPDTVRYMRDHVALHVDRCAVIDDGGWAQKIERLLAPAAGAETRHFRLDEEPEAWTWLQAREIAEKA